MVKEPLLFVADRTLYNVKRCMLTECLASDPIKKVKIKRFSTMRNRFNNVLHRFKNDSDRFRIVDQ